MTRKNNIPTHHALVIAFAGVMTTADSAVDRRHRVVYHHRQCDAAINGDDCEEDLRDRVRRNKSDSDLIYHHQTVAMT